ncbi:MAG: murein biosynthesis integral membrane protein MurJ [Gemmatimonadota bacterium]
MTDGPPEGARLPRQPEQSRVEPEPEKEAASAGSSAHWVAAGILLSRISGVVREIFIARFFGTNVAADAWAAAARMPNVLQVLLGEGTLSASFIPEYSKLLEEGRENEAGRLAGAIFALLLAVAGGLALIGALLAPVLVSVFTPGFDGLQRELTIQLVRILFPMAGVLVLSAWSLGVLNSHRRFFIPYVAPVIWNASMIAALLIWGPGTESSDLVVIFGWAALLGGGLQFLVQLPWVLRLERSLKLRWQDRTMPAVVTTVKNAGPAILGRGVVQVSSYIDMFLASFLVAGAVGALRYGLTLYMLPVALFGMSVAASELPELSRRRDRAVEILQQRVRGGLRQIAFFVVPTAVGYFVIGRVIIAALFERGEFEPSDTIWTHFILMGYTVGLIATTGTRLFSSAYFALQDTKTPAKYAAVRVGLAAVAGGSLMLLGQNVVVAGKPLSPAGLALGSGLAAWVEWYLLRRELRSRIGPTLPPIRVLGKMVGAALGAAAVGRGLMTVLPDWNAVFQALVILLVYAAVYFAVAAALGLPEVGRSLARVRRFLGRG